MKKAICLLLVFCLLAALSACGTINIDLPVNGSTEKPAPQTTAEKPADLTVAPTETEAPVTTEEPAPVTTEPAPAQPAEAPEVSKLPARWTLQELGAVDNSGKDLYFYKDNVFRYVRESADSTYLIATDPMGNPISEEKYGNVSCLMPSVYAVSLLSDDINSTGILLENGEQALPCEAAIIRTLNESFNSDLISTRYLYLIYGTETTTDKSEAFFYTTSAMISLTPSEGDTLYKGYGKVYDLQERRIVPDLMITNSSTSAVKTAGNLIVCTNEDYSYSVYNSNGELLFSGSGVDVGNDFFIVDYKTVMDVNGDTLYTSDAYLQIIKGTGNYMYSSDYKTSLLTVYDKNGAVLFEISDDYSVSRDEGGYFQAKKDSAGYLLDAEGKEVFKVEDSSYPSYEGYGIWEISPNDSELPSVYYLADGRNGNCGQRYLHDLVNEVKNETSGVHTYRFWNDPETDVNIEGSYIEGLTSAILYVHGKPGKLIDCFSGETLLTADDFEFVKGGYVYAKTGNDYTVYKLELGY